MGQRSWSAAALALLLVAGSALADEGWRFRLSPYMWLAGLKGDVATIPPLPTVPIDISASDALSDFEGGGMLLLDAKGALHEQVYDVLCSDRRAINDKHRCDKPVGNTVDVKKATYTNSIGDALMLAYWRDPAFDAKQRAFYYVRVLEIPTPRWTTYDAAFFGVELPKDVPPTHQERAYTSPIWYTP